MQYLQVKFPETDRWYSYQWDGEKPLQIDDLVWVPPNRANEFPTQARVVAHGRNPEYNGPLSTLLGLVEERSL